MRTPLLATLFLVGLLAVGCGGGDDSPQAGAPAVSEDPGPIHVHGLGVNPADGVLFVATHTGLFRAPSGEGEAVRVAERYQDTMGFTIVGPDRFLGSGHPDGREGLPPFLGLIESGDAGESWRPVSLLGDADFHALEARGTRVYGFGSDWESRSMQFLVSSDGGETWESRTFPEPFVSLAIHPAVSDRIAAGGQNASYISSDAGRTWRRLGAGGGLVAWNSPDELVRVDGEGTVHSSEGDAGWRRVGQIGGPPAALEAEADGLYVALHDGTIKRSADGGRSWGIRFTP